MQNDIYGSYDEVEPRQMPRPAAKFDSRPAPIVPEVSLIMEKSKKSNKMDDTLSNSIPESRATIPRNSTFKGNESYAAWKEKQYPQQPIRAQSSSPSRLHQIYSSSRSTSNLQDADYYRRSGKTDSPVANHDYGYRNQSPGRESPRYNTIRRSGPVDNPNKYTLSHARSTDEINHQPGNNYNYAPITHKREESPNYRRRPDHGHVIESYDPRQKQRIHRSSSCSNADAYAHRSVPIEHDYLPKHTKSFQPPHYSPEHVPRHSRSLPTAHYSPEHTHSHSYSYGCCGTSHNNSNNESETVKNLLLIITSQNEQIKSLQKQVERLLKLHEQSLRDRNQCTCQPNGVVYQNAHMYDQSRTSNLPIAHNNMGRENEKNYTDLKYPEDKSKPTILEQKVSIGVMTSFELKVQNNPSLALENEYKQKSNQQDKVLQNLPTSNIIKNLVNDTGEMIRKKPFNPTALENISEGSESHLSSLRQSHLGNDSTRQSVEAPDPVDVQNTNFYRQTFQENDSRQKRREPKKQKNGSDDKNNKRTTNLDYERQDARYERTRNEMQERAMKQYEFNFQEYDNLRSSPHGNLENHMEERKSEEYHNEPLLTDVIKMKNPKTDNFADECLSLSSSDLDVEDPSPPSPEPSIHLDMQEYSSEGGSLPPQRGKVGWTLYNNVLDQVNQILQNSNTNDDDEDRESPDDVRENTKKEYENNVIMDTVKAATLDQLTKLGISFSENVDQREPNYNKKVMFDASYYARQGPESHLAATSGSIETNTSIHMKALAMKYLNDDQLADMAMQKTRPNTFKQPPSNTNMSFATMHYLQRYHLLPGNNSSPMKVAEVREDYRAAGPVVNERIAMRTTERREPSPRRYQPFTGTSKVSYPSKILDISTLKQQPKLL